MRLQLVRSVDVMSYTVGVQKYLEQAPPKAVRADGASQNESPLQEGTRLWCGTRHHSSNARAHEWHVLDMVLSQDVHRQDRLRGLDIGSGYGGWPRMIALERPEVAQVVGIEYQEQVRTLADRLTDYAFEHEESARERISFWRKQSSLNDGNDVHDYLSELEGVKFDFVISFLALLHIGHSPQDRSSLISKVGGHLRIGGRLYFEDIVALPTTMDNPALAAKVGRVLGLSFLATHQDYVAIMKGFDGFSPASAVFDVTDAWKAFVKDRNANFRRLRPESSLCLLVDGSIVPSVNNSQLPIEHIECQSLSHVLGGQDMAKKYLKSQASFFCGVCELFQGRGTLAESDCACDESDGEDHPPLIGGAIMFAQK